MLFSSPSVTAFVYPSRARLASPRLSPLFLLITNNSLSLMAWKCSLELTHVYNIQVYCNNIPPRALRNYVISIKSHNLLWNTPRGERVDMGKLALSQKFGNSKPQHRIVFTTRRYRHITPPMDLARRYSPLALGFLSVCLSICLRSVYHQRENSRARRPRRGGPARRRTRWTPPLRFSLSRCAEILSWITINLSQ